MSTKNDLVRIYDDGDTVEVRMVGHVFGALRRSGEPLDLVWYRIGKMIAIHLKKLSEDNKS